jgi:hypothetical protein
MTYAERILDYLWAIAPDGATNGQLARHLGIRSQQTVYTLTQQLMSTGRIRGERSGAIWVFHAVEQPASSLVAGRAWPGDRPAAARFEERARRVLAEHYAVPLPPGSVAGVRKRFDFLSPDHQVVGDATYFTLVGGVGLSPAKFSIIAEHVWLLEKTGAPTTFLVFGNDLEIPVHWLERYGNLASMVTFFFLSDGGALETLGGTDR